MVEGPYKDSDKSLFQVLKDEWCSRKTAEGQELLGRERMAVAVHESGHVLIALLMRMRMQGASLGWFQIRHETLRKLTKVMGPLALPLNIVLGSYMCPVNEDDAFFRKHAANEMALFAVAGIASSVAQGYDGKSERYLTHWLETAFVGRNVTEWNDIAYPRSYIYIRFREVVGREPTDAEVIDVMKKIFDELVELFKTSRFVEAMNVLQEHLFHHGELYSRRAGTVNEQLQLLLEDAGFDQKVLDEMYIEMMKIDIDKAINESLEAT